MLDARELPVSPLQEQGHACPILNIRSVHLGHAAPGPTIYQYVALTAIDAFRAVVATNTADTRRPHGLAVDDASPGIDDGPPWHGAAHAGPYSGAPRYRPNATHGNSDRQSAKVRTRAGATATRSHSEQRRRWHSRSRARGAGEVGRRSWAAVTAAPVA